MFVFKLKQAKAASSNAGTFKVTQNNVVLHSDNILTLSASPIDDSPSKDDHAQEPNLHSSSELLWRSGRTSAGPSSGSLGPLTSKDEGPTILQDMFALPQGEGSLGGRGQHDSKSPSERATLGKVLKRRARTVRRTSLNEDINPHGPQPQATLHRSRPRPTSSTYSRQKRPRIRSVIVRMLTRTPKRFSKQDTWGREAKRGRSLHARKSFTLED